MQGTILPSLNLRYKDSFLPSFSGTSARAGDLHRYISQTRFHIHLWTGGRPACIPDGRRAYYQAKSDLQHVPFQSSITHEPI